MFLNQGCFQIMALFRHARRVPHDESGFDRLLSDSVSRLPLLHSLNYRCSLFHSPDAAASPVRHLLAVTSTPSSMRHGGLLAGFVHSHEANLTVRSLIVSYLQASFPAGTLINRRI